MTSNLKDILEKACGLASAKAVRKASDEDFMARVEAVCLIRRIYDGLYLDNSELIHKMKRLYPEFARRIESKENKQDVLPLMKSFHRFVYGTSFVRHSIGVQKWQEELTGYEEKFGLDNDNESLFNSQETTGLSITQLKRRSSQSKQIYVEYLSELTKREFARINEAADERQLRRQLKSLNEEIIPGLLNIRISSTMSVPTLRALEAIYTLRSWLSSASHDVNDPVYANLQVQRMWQILKALKTKYWRAKALTDKIETLTFIATLEEDLTSTQSPFALSEATKLEQKYGSTLTTYQRLGLQIARGGITEATRGEPEARGGEPEARGGEFSELAQRSGTNFPTESIPTLIEEATTAFDLGTLTLIEHRLSENLREAIFNRFTLLLEASIKANNTAEISNFLSLFPFWNENPAHRQKIKAVTEARGSEFSELATEAQQPARCGSVEGQRPLPEVSISLPVLRLNPIAAEIYSRLYSLTAKYESRTIPA